MSIDVQAHALRIVTAERVEAKLIPAPADLPDRPGRPLRLAGPGRPPELWPSAKAVRAPSAHGMHDPAQKVRLLHAFANHELQAVELFAWALLAYPDAPPPFRRGLLTVLGEEQTHVRMYQARLRQLGAALGDHPVNAYFWGKVADLTTPARFVCAMGLTFENANLDHTTHYALAARAAGDERTAQLIDRIHEDEVGHVAFGYRWLRAFKAPEQSVWEAYQDNVRWPLRAARARGRAFDPAPRRAAGLDDDFIEGLASSRPEALPQDVRRDGR